MKKNIALAVVVSGLSFSAFAAPKSSIPAIFCEGFRADDTNKERPYVLRPSFAQKDSEAAQKQGYEQALILAEIDPRAPSQRINPPSLGASRLHNMLFVGDLRISQNKQILSARFAPRNLDTMKSNEAVAELTINDQGTSEAEATFVLNTRLQADRSLGAWQTLTYNLKCSL